MFGGLVVIVGSLMFKWLVVNLCLVVLYVLIGSLIERFYTSPALFGFYGYSFACLTMTCNMCLMGRGRG